MRRLTTLEATSHHVALYHAEGCHLCDRALEVVRDAQAEVPFTLELVDITATDALEAAYREHIPVIEIDGVRAFTYFVTPEALLARLGADGSPDARGDRQGNM